MAQSLQYEIPLFVQLFLKVAYYLGKNGSLRMGEMVMEKGLACPRLDWERKLTAGLFRLIPAYNPAVSFFFQSRVE